MDQGKEMTSNILNCIDSNVLSGLLDNSDFEAVVSGLPNVRCFWVGWDKSWKASC